MSEQEIIDRKFIIQGAAGELFNCEDQYVLAESGAGTSKTFTWLLKANATARAHPGCRILFCRATRKSLNESVLDDWENKILWRGHPAITGTASKEHRDYYEYPNGSRIVLAGLDNVDRIMSAQYDRIIIFEATEVTKDDWEKLSTRLRNFQTPYHQIGADCNPAQETHWLNRSKGITRIHFRHEDNPLLWSSDTEDWTPEGTQYLNTLNQLTGVRRERLLLHRWVSAEGLVWPMWDEVAHVKTARIEDDGQHKWLHIKGEQEPVRLEWYFAGMDFGYRGCGCLQIWGVDQRERSYRVAEVYRREKTLDWWSEVASALYQEFPFRTLGADSAEPRSIEHLNDWFYKQGIPKIAKKVDKGRNKMHGVNHVRALFENNRIFWLRDALRYGRDPEADKKGLPTCSEEEIPAWTFDDGPDGSEKEVERPDPNCLDHGIDTTIYCMLNAWKKRLGKADPRPMWKEGTTGQLAFGGFWNEILSGKMSAEEAREKGRERRRSELFG